MYYQNGKYLETITLSYREWNKRIKNIFYRNIRNNHISGDEASIERDLQDCVIEIQPDNQSIVIACDRYKELYKTAGVRAEQ